MSQFIPGLVYDVINRSGRAGTVGNEGPPGPPGDPGEPGPPGNDGTPSYFHMKFSDNPDGTDMNDTGGKYIGTYVDSDPIDSDDKTKYTWRLFAGTQGDQGIPGVDGQDGRTSYLHIKYSDDGLVFTGNGGETVGKWMGTCVDFNETDPTTFNSYTWKKIEGPIGPTGPTGPQGAQGLPGNPGATGTSFRARGVWDSATQYLNSTAYTDVVTYNGNTYYCKQTNTGQTPGDTSYWGTFVQQGMQGVQGPIGPQGPSGDDSYSMVLSNDAITVPCNADGSGSILTGAVTTVYLYNGTVAITPTLGALTVSQCTAVKDDTLKTVTITSVLADTGYVDIPVSNGATPVGSKRFTFAKSKQGVTGPGGSAGNDSYSMILSNEAVTLPCNADGTGSQLSGAVTTVYLYKGNSTKVVTLGTLTSSGCTATKDDALKTVTITSVSADVGYVDIPIYDGAALIGNKRFSFAKSKQGIQGPTGIQGPQGIQGPTGANGVNSYFHTNFTDMQYTNEWDIAPASMTNTTVVSCTNSILRVTSTSIDPGIMMYGIGSFDPNKARWFEMRYRVASGTAGTMEFFFCNTAYTSANAAQRIQATLVSDNQWHTVAIDCWSNANWKVTPITGWRLDWCTANAVTMDIDYIRLANDMNDTTGTWIGTYVDSNSADSTDYGTFNWVKVQGSQGPSGTQGIPGVSGADGKTSYLHIKYSDNGTTFTASSGETPGKWIGQYVDFTIDDSTNFSDYTWSLVQGTAGADSYSIILSNEAITIPCAPDGSSPQLSGAVTQVYLYLGQTQITNPTMTIAATNCAASIDEALDKVTITSVNADLGYIDITVNNGAMTVGTKRFSWSKSKQGATGSTGATGSSGTDSYSMVLSNDSINIPCNFDGSGANVSGASTTIYLYKGSGTRLASLGALSVSGCTASTNGTTVTINTVTADSGYVDIPISDGATLVGTKRFSFAKSKQGTTGSQGPGGSAGVDAYAITLSNEAVNIPCASDGSNPQLSGAVTTVFLYKGTTAKTVTLGTLTVSGCTVSKNDVAKTVTIATVTADTGYVDIQVLDGATVVGTKRFSFAKSKQGTTGSQGPGGPAGADSYSIVLSNEAITVPCNSDGSSPQLVGASTTVYLYKGTSPLTVTLGTVTDTNCTHTISTNTISIATVSSDTGYIDIQVKDGSTVVGTKRFSFAKSKQGTQGSQGPGGADSYSMILSNESVNIPCNSDGTSPQLGGAVTTVYLYKGSGSLTATLGTLTTSNCTVTSSSATVTIATVTADMGYVDIQIKDGATVVGVKRFSFAKSKQGTQGSQGPGGPAGEDSYAVTLSNEAVTVPCNSDGTSPQLAGASTTVFLYKGSNSIAPTLGTLSHSNCTSTISGSTITLATVTADTGYIDIPILDGATSVATKRFSFAKSKQGVQGGTGPTGPGGTDSYSMILSSEATTIPTDKDGNNPNLTGATTTAYLYKGTSSKTVTLGTLSVSGCTASKNDATKVITILTLTADTGYVDIPMSDGGTSVGTKRFSFAKSKQGTQGPAGSDAYSIVLSNEATSIPTDSAGNNAILTGASTVIYLYKGVNTIEPVLGTITPSGCTASKDDVANKITITAVSADAGYVDVDVYDGATLVGNKRFSFAKSKQGNQGSQGPGGVDSYSIILSNEAINVPCNNDGTNSNLAGANTTVYLYKGTLSKTPTIGTPTVSGCTASFNNTNHTVSIDTVLADTGYVDIPISDGATSVGTKRFSFAKAKAGTQGTTGPGGPSGTDSYSMILSNEASTIPCNADGSSPQLSGASTTVYLYKGTSSITPTLGTITDSNCTHTVNNATVTLATVTADTGYVDIQIKNGATVVGTKRFSFSKSKQGQPGETGVSYRNLGAWINTTAYVNNSSYIDTVNYQGSLYACYASNTGQVPTNVSYWTLLVQKGDTGPQGLQGVPGPAGSNGQTSYFHVKYSNDGGVTFTGNSGENVGTWIGTYVDFNPTDSATISNYTWVQAQGSQGPQGTQGIPGTNGVDGKTSYLHIKYSNDGTTFTGSSGEVAGKWIGQYVDFTLADSMSFSAYTWTKIEGPQGPQGTTGVQGPPGTNGQSSYFHTKYVNRVWEETFDSLGTSTGANLASVTSATIAASATNQWNCATIVNNLKANTCYYVKLNGELVSGTAAKFQLYLYDAQSTLGAGNILSTRVSFDFSPPGSGLTTWYFSTPDDPRTYEILAYAGIGGATVNNSVEYSNIEVYELIDAYPRKDTVISVNPDSTRSFYATRSRSILSSAVYNPEVAGDVAGFGSYGGSISLSTLAPQMHGVGNIRFLATPGGAVGGAYVKSTAITAGKKYHCQGYARAVSGAVPTLKAALEWHDSTGAIINGVTYTAQPSTLLTTTGWSRVYCEGVAPPNATTVTCTYYSTSLTTANDVWAMDEFELNIVGNDPYITMANVGSWDPNKARYIEVKYKTSTATSMEIFYMTANGPSPDSTRVLSQTLTADGTWRTVVFDGWSSANWKVTGSITGFRFDYCTVTDMQIDIQYFTLIDDMNDNYGSWIGSYVDQTVNDSTSYTSYTWNRIEGMQGEQGLPGQDGTNGQTSYLHIKYSDNGTSFTPNNGEDPGKWMGTCVDFNITDPSTFNSYVWNKIEGPTGPAGPVLDWITDWDGTKVDIKGDKIVTPKIFAGINGGTSANPILTGIAIGRDVKGGGDALVGIIGYNANNQTLQIDTDGSAVFGSTVGRQFIVNVDGSVVTPTLKAGEVTADKLSSGTGLFVEGNLCSGKTVTGTSATDVARVNDGLYQTGSAYYSFGSGNSSATAAESAYVQVDLGQTYRVGQVKVFFWSEDDRYYWFKFKYSVDGTNWIYGYGNSATTGWCTSAPRMYTGMKYNPTVLDFQIPISARYLRVYANGNSVNTGNHIYEMEAYCAGRTIIDGGQITVGTIDADTTTISGASSGVTINSSGLTIVNGKFVLKNSSGTTVISNGIVQTDTITMVDNVDATHKLKMKFYIDSAALEIRSVKLAFSLEKFRAYETGALGGGSATYTSGGWSYLDAPSSTEYSGWGYYTGYYDSTYYGFHQHPMPMDWGHHHTTDMSTHTHPITIDSHTHPLSYGIFESTVATSVDVYVDGTLRLNNGGTHYATDQAGLELKTWITTTGWHTIELSSTTLGRINASLWFKTYVAY